MIIIDTNIILRYLLNDNIELNRKATEIIENNDIFIPIEVIIEATYVLKKVYSVSKEDIYNAIQELLDIENINFQNKNTINLAFETYKENNLDIVDCVLYAYSKIDNKKVETFDRKLEQLIKTNNKN